MFPFLKYSRSGGPLIETGRYDFSPRWFYCTPSYMLPACKGVGHLAPTRCCQWGCGPFPLHFRNYSWLVLICLDLNDIYSSPSTSNVNSCGVCSVYQIHSTLRVFGCYKGREVIGSILPDTDVSISVTFITMSIAATSMHRSLAHFGSGSSAMYGMLAVSKRSS